MAISKDFFGKDSNGNEVYTYTITNSNGMSIKVSELGAVLVEVNVPDRAGNMADVVLGYDNVEQYEMENSSHFGATVGRNANRIKDGKFTINGKTYQLEKNNGENNLHSGPDFYGKRLWESQRFESEDGEGVVFALLSPDGDQGMPGQLSITVTYVLTADNAVVIEYDGVSGEDTIVNMTNHSYFNLAGQGAGDVLEHELWIDADEFTPGDAALIPSGEIVSVEGTPMDFRVPKKIGQDIHADYEPLIFGGGYDHNYVLKTDGDEIELIAKLSDRKSGRSMEVYTDMPGVQLYTANTLNVEHGKHGAKYGNFAAACLETQFFPDAVNHPNFQSPVVKADVPFNYVTVYKFITE